MNGSGHVDNGRRAVRFRHGFAVFVRVRDVKPDHLPDLASRVLPGGAGGDAAGQVGNVGGLVVRRSFDDDGVPPSDRSGRATGDAPVRSMD